MVATEKLTEKRETHSWLRKTNIIYAPGKTTPLLENVAKRLLASFENLGHHVQNEADHSTDVVLTTASFGKPLNWRESYLFTVRRKLGIDHTPTIYTLMHATPDKFHELLSHFKEVLETKKPEPGAFDFDGLSPNAHSTLFEQGKRGGPIMALMRVLQSQSKSIRIILVIGEEEPQYAYMFDLVGAHPKIEAADLDFFYNDIALRMITSLSTGEITEHKEIDPPITEEEWKNLSTPKAMKNASLELGKRDFFTDMVRVSDLVHVPAVADAVSSQYSEGCFATWEPNIEGLIATVTGSARPVDKDAIKDEDLAVIVGVRPDGLGALVRCVEGKQNDPPSSEAVELIAMDKPLPTIKLGEKWVYSAEVPVARSKLHGHRGISSYNPALVEYAPLGKPYFYFPVSCATEAQAKGIIAAFSRSEALTNPNDSRNIVFTILPGHGIVIVEKWILGKEPFQAMYELMDSGDLVIDNFVPQGPLHYKQDNNGNMQLEIP